MYAKQTRREQRAAGLVVTRRQAGRWYKIRAYRFLAVHLHYPDVSLSTDLARGMPLVGDVPASGVFIKRSRPVDASIDSWHAGIPDRNRRMYERTARYAQSEDSKQISRDFWGKTLLDVEQGWISAPVSVTPHAMACIPLARRSAIEEVHGGRAGKIRPLMT